MKIFLLSIVLIFTAVFVHAQQALDYFPQQTGYRWDFKVIPLDSANNEIDSMAYFRVDSFAVVSNFMGKSADLVLSKTGPYTLINYMPFTDTAFFSFEGSDAYQYFRISNLENIVGLLDSLGVDPSILGIIHSFEDWYSVFRFAQSVNNEYTIFSKDTSVIIGSDDYPVRFEYLGKRLNDETIQTEAGTFTCKKFLISTVVSYLIIFPPPLPPVPIEMVRLKTTKWLAENIWLVQELSPSINVDFSRLGFGSFTIPGSKTELIPLITNIKDQGSIVNEFVLAQNYPNPFNPETRINFKLPEKGNVTLKIYDILGREVMTLLNEERNSGSYSVAFNPDRYRLASGVYIYELKFKGMRLSHKMIYLK
jgi:hypothetical protein